MAAQLGASATAARAHEELFAYWASLRQPGRLPGRADIRPEDFKRLLPTVSLVDVLPSEHRRDYRLRLAGTGLYSVYGREITGRTLEDVYNSAAVDYWRRELDKVVTERRPGVGVHSLAWKGSPHMSILWLRLPLASNGKDVDMILGYDAVVGVQSDNGLSGGRYLHLCTVTAAPHLSPFSNSVLRLTQRSGKRRGDRECHQDAKRTEQLHIIHHYDFKRRI